MLIVILFISVAFGYKFFKVEDETTNTHEYYFLNTCTTDSNNKVFKCIYKNDTHMDCNTYYEMVHCQDDSQVWQTRVLQTSYANDEELNQYPIVHWFYKDNECRSLNRISGIKSGCYLLNESSWYKEEVEDSYFHSRVFSDSKCNNMVEDYNSSLEKCEDTLNGEHFITYKNAALAINPFLLVFIAINLLLF